MDSLMSSMRESNDEPYHEYFSKWTEEQQQFCKELLDGLNGDVREEEMRELVQKVINHYEAYYAAKDGAAKQDVLEVMHPSWMSPLENAFLWIGGWRPTMIFQLAYAQAGQQMEAELADFLQGINTPMMTSLSAKQLSRVSNLQIQTHKAEDELSHRQAVLQQSLADQPLLSLALELGREIPEEGKDGNSDLKGAVDEKVKTLEDLVCAADELRLQSLKEFLKILTPKQSAQYLIAAGQLHSTLRKIGMAKQEEEIAARNKESS